MLRGGSDTDNSTMEKQECFVSIWLEPVEGIVQQHTHYKRRNHMLGKLSHFCLLITDIFTSALCIFNGFNNNHTRPGIGLNQQQVHLHRQRIASCTLMHTFSGSGSGSQHRGRFWMVAILLGSLFTCQLGVEAG